MKRIGLTIGDAAGVGPQLLLQCAPELAQDRRIVAYGDSVVLEAARRSLAARGATPLVARVVPMSTPADADGLPADTLGVIDCDPAGRGAVEGEYPWGHAVAAFGRLQYAALERAIADAMAGELARIVTAPWHKKRMADAGLPPTGHTEVLERLTCAERAVMLLAGDVLRVALVTSHVPLRAVAEHITVDAICEVGTTLERGLREFYGIARPRVAVCGLNPHAGEEGVIGTEDRDVIAPAVARMTAAGLDVSGPYPADTLFPRVANGALRADGIVAMYHDQGLAPLKTFHFGNAANITLGLPIVRTSVDHGTAYDIAGTSSVDRSSFLYAARVGRAG
jgi:4-hydroxythreonine-4-phosphate dehydrogenase